jgi:hypothetical protein
MKHLLRIQLLLVSFGSMKQRDALSLRGSLSDRGNLITRNKIATARASPRNDKWVFAGKQSGSSVREFTPNVSFANTLQQCICSSQRTLDTVPGQPR